ncbi:hypothetical protein [Roseibium sp. LAB1]
MDQLELFQCTGKGQPGATWWAGRWQCRNMNGWFQDREDGKDPWYFVVYAFGDSDCVVYRLDEAGTLVHHRAPIDPQGRITIDGRKYGRRNWRH